MKIMRQTQKEYVERSIKLIEQAHLEIKKALKNRKNDVALSLLGQCQEAAITLGNFIEVLEGKGFITVSLLETYCEFLFQCHRKILQGKIGNVEEIYKNLHKLFIQMENSIKNDISIRKEAVFLPYKASMWDSLESVWMAACNDPDYDVYVVPIPYYDKNEDGTFREMYYEGDQYPDYVPILNYEDFDLETHHPDLIFIHNPYDEYNYVTSVHPFFYSSNLKKYTDKLVYIPYFILTELRPDQKDQIEKIEHFCTVPAVIRADQIIVQSEDMRQIYVNIMTEKYGKNTRKMWEKKILGLGSPKYDRVLSIKKEELEIPEEWRRIIEKPDGSWKKIILYNTGVGALLKHSDQMMKKIRSVLEIFHENTEEIALLWRPHPLMKSTIMSLRPHLWSEYEKLVQKYLDEGWGIYDASADLDRALVISDAYYGDGSSLIRLYKRLGKPVMIQNVNCL